ncbi:MAG: Transcriptional regulator, GntR family, partial [uncultured Nocardioides sp.]
AAGPDPPRGPRRPSVRAGSRADRGQDRHRRASQRCPAAHRQGTRRRARRRGQHRRAGLQGARGRRPGRHGGPPRHPRVLDQRRLRRAGRGRGVRPDLPATWADPGRGRPAGRGRVGTM